MHVELIVKDEINGEEIKLWPFKNEKEEESLIFLVVVGLLLLLLWDQDHLHKDKVKTLSISIVLKFMSVIGHLILYILLLLLLSSCAFSSSSSSHQSPDRHQSYLCYKHLSCCLVRWWCLSIQFTFKIYLCVLFMFIVYEGGVFSIVVIIQKQKG